MNLAGAILALLLAYPRHAEDAAEPALARVGRLADHADSIALVSLAATCQGPWRDTECRRRWRGSPVSLAALLARTAYEETGLSARIHRGECRPGECDGGAARGPLWERIDASPEGTLAGAWAATLIYSGAAWYCRDSEDWRAGAVSAYATGSSCAWSGAPDRVDGWRRAERYLRRCWAG